MKSTLVNSNGQEFERGPTRNEMVDKIIADARIRIRHQYGPTPRYDPDEFCMHPSRCRCGYCYKLEEIYDLLESGDLSDEQVAEINDYRPRKGETTQAVMERCAIC